MAEKRTVRFVKWLIKVVISYAVFIGIGWLLGRIPAERIGLSEDMFFDLRMFFMLFGPIYRNRSIIPRRVKEKSPEKGARKV